MTNSADPDVGFTDLDLHCLLRQGMSCSAREELNIYFLFVLQNRAKLIRYWKKKQTKKKKHFNIVSILAYGKNYHLRS